MKIFAYGSLMWRPDFTFVQARPARLTGYHRRLSVFSHHYRGTVEKPGLVLGLDRGGSCVGIVYDIAVAEWDKVSLQVREREMLGDVYQESWKQFIILDSTEKVTALTYIVRRESAQYAPAMPVAELTHFIDQGQGTMGSCRDYVANTLLHLRQLGIHDRGLEALAAHVLKD